MDNRFKVSVAVAIFARTENDKRMPSKCAFYDKDGQIYLPHAPVTDEFHANQVAMMLIRQTVPVDPKLLSITPIGFFDPILEDKTLRADREILLGYRVIVSPGMPVLNELEFKDNEELRIALSRVKETHYRLFRIGIYQ